ncbi:hypothetical protein [Lichenifustis flavocetrariae]|uniref:Uncharacterized protein n=1 Tax=Lichenifustis flavocetrariae TaxID=2949735 RepID=A0AA41YVB6_9HYPH|nr:hypothetical protein [Lichenifustis flavocetrariae]MCW6507777.1 hypothetical protein [Lichenifustis flavocetrariae]
MTAVALATSPPDAIGDRASRAERRSAFILLAPALLFLLPLSIWPFVYLLYASLTSYQLAIPIPMTFVGWGNFVAVLKNARFWHSLEVTAAFALISVFPYSSYAGWRSRCC